MTKKKKIFEDYGFLRVISPKWTTPLRTLTQIRDEEVMHVRPPFINGRTHVVAPLPPSQPSSPLSSRQHVVSAGQHTTTTTTTQDTDIKKEEKKNVPIPSPPTPEQARSRRSPACP